MSLEKMLAAQKKLDERIVKEKGLEGKDLVANTYVALDVELGEMANEARWFKHWSEDREPRTYGLKLGKSPRENRYINPLLEEYIDSLHFFLSLAIQKGWEKQLYVYEEAILDLQAEGFDGGLSGAYLEMIYYLNKSYMENNRSEKIEKTFNKTLQEFNFNTAWFLFIAIGLIGFEFTEEQIEQAYFAKNTINHQRQDNGY